VILRARTGQDSVIANLHVARVRDMFRVPASEPSRIHELAHRTRISSHNGRSAERHLDVAHLVPVADSSTALPGGNEYHSAQISPPGDIHSAEIVAEPPTDVTIPGPVAAA
jgi:hypothetical protein